MNKKVIEKRCSNCTFNYIQNRTYRDMCNKNKYALVIPDNVINWIALFGCVSWKKA